MRSLILDQSTTTVGFALVEGDPNTPVSFGVTGRLITHGRITTPAKAGLVDRLGIIKADLGIIIRRYHPVNEMVIENTTFVQRSGSTSNAMGAIFILCRELAHKYSLAFYTQNPSTVKKRVTGDGKADKEAVIEAVMHLWGMTRCKIKDDNHADALAAAYVWLYSAEEIRKSTEK